MTRGKSNFHPWAILFDRAPQLCSINSWICQELAEQIQMTSCLLNSVDIVVCFKYYLGEDRSMYYFLEIFSKKVGYLTVLIGRRERETYKKCILRFDIIVHMKKGSKCQFYIISGPFLALRLGGHPKHLVRIA